MGHLFCVPTRLQIAMSGLNNPDRRTVLASIGGLATGSIGMYVVSDDAHGTTLQVDEIVVSDANQSIVDPLATLEIAVSGSFDITSDVQPSKVVLRLEGKESTSEEYSQLAATDWSQTVEKEMGQQFSFTGDLLSLPSLSSSDLTPSETGQTESVTVDIRLLLEVRHDSQVLESHTVQDSADIQITREEPGVSMSIEASGNITAND